MKRKIALVLVCILAITLLLCGCKGEKKDINDAVKETTFTLYVVYEDGKEETFDISTTEKTVGSALLKEGLIEGDDSSYGLYIKSVNGVVADYDKTGTYWAFYVDDEYAAKGVDETKIKENTKYTLKVEK